MKEEFQKLLEEANEILEEKEKYSQINSSLAAMGEDELKLPKELFRKVKDYQHYKGLGWIDSPIGSLDPNVKFPDRVNPIFRKLVEIIKDCSSVGMLDLIEDYIVAAKQEGIEIKINLPKMTKNDKFAKIVDQMDANQTVICELANKLRDEYKPALKEKNYCPERDFNAVLRLYNSVKKCKDIHDPATEIITDSIIVKDAATEIIEISDADWNFGEE